MHKVLSRWYEKMFADPEAVVLLLVLLLSGLVIYFFGDLLGPMLVALVFAYLIDWPVSSLAQRGLKRNLSATIVLLMFALIAVFFALVFFPTVWRQATTLIAEYPQMLNSLQRYLGELPQRYPDYINGEIVDSFISSMREKLLMLGEQLVQASFSSIINIATLVVYSVLVPLMVFFMVADKDKLLLGVDRFLPNERKLLKQVWSEMNAQIANYVRGKFIEIVLVGGVSYVVFMLMDLRYAALLSVLVGLSVLIPFIGAFSVTVPVAMVGLFQWGISPQFGYLLLAYAVIQILDGNVLVPLLFSEAVNLHPLYIIVAVLFFGGLWGFWGVFFAIPLATLVKAVINAWPRSRQELAQESH